MKSLLVIIVLQLGLISSLATFPPNNEVDMMFDSSSYDTPAYDLWGDYFCSYVYCMNPSYTNRIISWSQSGSALQGDYENNEQKWCLPFQANFPVASYNLILANDNGGYVSNTCLQWLTNIAAAPAEYWNGTAKTNEGYGSLSVTYIFPGAIPHDDINTFYTAAKPLNDASTNASALVGTADINLLERLTNGGWNASDIGGARRLGFYAGSHPYPAGHLCMTLHTLLGMGAETNIGSMTFNWNAATVSTNHCVVSGVSLVGGTLTSTVHFDRMPGAWDVPDGTITNDARNAFVVMPTLADTFRWILQITNLPVGNYDVSIDGSNVVTLSSSQLSTGWNMFTNYSGALWAQRKEVLGRKRDQIGLNRVALTQLGVNNGAIPGATTLQTFQSNANQQYSTLGKRGSAYVSAMATFLAGMTQYDVAIYQAALQTNHTFTITLQSSTLIPAPFR